MKRRIFLTRCAMAASLTMFSPWDRWADAQAPPSSVPVTLNIGAEQSTLSIPPDFLGLSYEAAQMPRPDFFNPENKSLLALIHRLGERGVLRIGGNSSEFTQFQADGAAPVVARPLPPKAKASIITPGDIQRMAKFVRATGWKLIYGLNLGTGTPEQAAAEAAAVSQAAGDSLLTFQIGNEPDLFSHNGLRPKTYGLRDYLKEWHTFAEAVHARVPGAPLAGPDAAVHPNWFTTMAQQDADALVLLTQHYYAEGPGSSPASTIGRLLRARQHLPGKLQVFQDAAKQAHRPWRMAETNSCYGGGRYGVSDTLAAALWSVDYLFPLADAGCTGANFHGGASGAYTPTARVTDTADYAPRPLYYGMLLFAQAAHGHLVSAQLTGAPVGLTAHAVRDGDALSTTVINTDESQSVRLRIDPGRHFATGSVLRLTGPNLASTTGVSLGGTAVGPDGAWSPTAHENARFEGQQIVLDVPAASAATVLLH